ncbi:MAG: hypothetical protein K2L82_11115 [Lachnospiraceae bacterium]|nr:hypothetical protein [Lachnospiraceae bacterium]
MKKKIMSIIMILSLACSTCMVALAEDDNMQFVSTASQMKSKGAIVYQNGTDSVVIDSNDLYVLADTLDQFKFAVYSQMAEMNTYLTTEERGINLTTSSDIYVAHLAPQDKVDPMDIEFDTLMEGFAATQSIPYTPLEYGYTDETKLYKTATGFLTTDASVGTEMIEIEEATADGISAGKAAWVNGELILGTGVDNQAYYNLGYTDGLNKAMDAAHIDYIYHTHTGNAAAGTGCYTKRTYGDSTNVKFYSTWVSSGYRHWSVQCQDCREIFTNVSEAQQNWQNLVKVHHNCSAHPNGWTIGCGKTSSTIEQYIISFN